MLPLLAVSAALLCPLSSPAEDAPAPSPVQTELRALVKSVQTKITDGKRTEADLADELKQFDVLIAKENGARTDEAAEIIFMKAQLYLEILDNPEKGSTLIKQIKADYPDTKVGKQADRILSSIEKQAAAKKNSGRPGDGGRSSPTFRKKICLANRSPSASSKARWCWVDFWATWCGPCRAELPNVIEAYGKYHAQGFEIIGVSLDSDREKLDSFLKKQDGMVWAQYFDGEGWGNKLAAKYGVESIPFTVLIGPDGKIIGKDLRGEDLGKAVADRPSAKNNRRTIPNHINFIPSQGWLDRQPFFAFTGVL